jgi:ArsR family transcriptional regulator, arsenate/arsenite/antimonite-responsive transcriptional repressor
MEKIEAVTALAALAQVSRLDVFRLLVEAGPEGMPAGQIANTLGLAPNTLTFHFDRLRGAGLVTSRREGRSMIYAARFETINALLGYLTDNCCGGTPETCFPARYCQPAGENWQGVGEVYLLQKEERSVVSEPTVNLRKSR